MKEAITHTASVRHGSLFVNTKVDLSNILKRVFKYINGNSYADIINELSVDRKIAYAYFD